VYKFLISSLSFSSLFILFCTLHQSLCFAHQLALLINLFCLSACFIYCFTLSTSFLCLPALFIHVIFSTLKFQSEITVWKSHQLSLLILYNSLFLISNWKLHSKNMFQFSVSDCKNWLSGNCFFDHKCHFKHDPSKQNSQSTARYTISNHQDTDCCY